MNEYEKVRQREYARRYYWRHKEKIQDRIKTKYRPNSKKKAAERQAREERLLGELVETYDNIIAELLKLIRMVQK